MRSPLLIAVLAVAVCAAVGGALEVLAGEASNLGSLAAALVAGRLVSVADAVRFGWREPDERRRSS